MVLIRKSLAQKLHLLLKNFKNILPSRRDKKFTSAYGDPCRPDDASGPFLVSVIPIPVPLTARWMACNEIPFVCRSIPVGWGAILVPCGLLPVGSSAIGVEWGPQPVFHPAIPVACGAHPVACGEIPVACAAYAVVYGANRIARSAICNMVRCDGIMGWL